METHVSLLLSQFTLGFGDFKNGFIEIISGNKRENVSYPQTTPLPLTFSPKFIKDKQLITINAKKKVGNKIKIIAHGELVLYKNNFIEGNGIIEKYITMVQLDSKFDTIKINKDNMGKIFVKVILEEPFEEWKNKLPNKAGYSANNTIYKKTIENKPIKSYRKINFDDNLSKLTITKIDKNNEDYKNINLEQFIAIKEIKKLKNKIDNEYQNILPHDFKNLKKMNENLYNHYQQLDINYKNILENINKENNDIKLKAKETWEKYKHNKSKLYKLRIEYKLKRHKFIKDINTYKEEKNNLIKSIEELDNNTKNAYNQIIGIKDKEKEDEKKYDIKKIGEIINRLYSLGYNIEDEMNEQEKLLLNSILSKYNINELGTIKNDEKKEVKKEDNVKNKEKKENEKKIEEYKEEDELLSEQIVALIERDVNDLYSRKLIQKMKIDQVNSITYSFSTLEKEMKVSLKIENNNLICSDGKSFSVWLITNFSS